MFSPTKVVTSPVKQIIPFTQYQDDTITPELNASLCNRSRKMTSKQLALMDPEMFYSLESVAIGIPVVNMRLRNA